MHVNGSTELTKTCQVKYHHINKEIKTRRSIYTSKHIYIYTIVQVSCVFFSRYVSFETMSPHRDRKSLTVGGFQEKGGCSNAFVNYVRAMP